MKMKMYRITLVVVLAFIVPAMAGAQNLGAKLEELSGKYSFTYKQMRVDTFFHEKYVVRFRQPLDHSLPGGKSFDQTVYLSHKAFDRPVVLITEGYSGYYGSFPNYTSEIAELIAANQILVEHRFFGNSSPDSLEWQYLTVKNAAFDHHRIVEAMKEIYSGAWVSTGISKGGQTMMYHRYFFPDDVDASVGYVCPLNFSIEDKRVYSFLERVGEPECRQRILDYQTELFQNLDVYLPWFENMANEKGYTYSMGNRKGYELTVLEYSFAFWQWGTTDCDSIPLTGADPEDMVAHLDLVAGLEWVSDQGKSYYAPFYYQALSEMGFYGYDITPFREWSSYETNPDFLFAAPAGTTPTYDPWLMFEVDCFVRHRAQNMIFIYGEWDPWSATAVELPFHTNSLKIVHPKGNHSTSIKTLHDKERELVLTALREWLKL